MAADGLESPESEVRGPGPMPLEGRLFGAFYLFEGAAGLLAVAMYKYHDRLLALSSGQGVVILAASAALLLTGAYVARTFVRSGPLGRRRFSLALAANLLAVAVMLGGAEAMVRLLTVNTPMGPSFGGTLLLPKRWERQRARNAELLRQAPNNISYFVRDTLLGWTVGPSRRSTNGLYLSSSEGIRSPRVGMAFADQPRRQHVATIGDSFTFGLESPYEDSWQSHLQRSLGDDVDALNFGVDGYGIDQAYLRYRRDVRPWHPVVTILGFIDHDLVRAMSVYTFLTFPNWGIPFSKPRFAFERGRLAVLNVPVMSPEDILAQRAVTDLPFVEYDPGYNRDEWTPHALYSSDLLRYVVSRFPRWPAVSEAEWVEREVELNRELLLAFARDATLDATIPLVVYFPTRGDFEGLDRSAKGRILTAMATAGIRHLDLTPCIRELGPSRAFRTGHQHYSGEGNAAVARCLSPVVRQELERLGSARHG